MTDIVKHIQEIADAASDPNKILIDGRVVPVEKKEITNDNIIKVEAGTNGYHGGDSGHGSRTHFAIENLSGTDMRLSFLCEPCHMGSIEVGDLLLRGRNGMSGSDITASRIEIDFGGDAELETFIEALEFAVATLKAQIGK